MSKNQIMIDHACSDKRSVSTMLRGTGDKREQAWLDYEEANKKIDDMELLIAAFAHKARYERIRSSNKMLMVRLYKFLLTVLAVLFVLA